MTTSGTTPKKRPLGSRSGIEVPAVGTGLWAVTGSDWGPSDDEATLAAIDAALEQGVDFFDTADVYGGGHSERLLGQAMKGRRQRFVVATKIGWVGYDGENNRSQYDTVDKLIAGVEESLRRLGTDHVDAIQCHIFCPEPNTPIFIEGFRKLKEQGKVRAWGVSTSDIEHLKTFNAEGDCDLIQIDYSILNRDAERDIFPYCRECGLGVIVRGPLAMGLLCGKFSDGTTFPNGDFRRNWIDNAEQHAQYLSDLETVARLEAIVPAGQTPAQFALRFARSHPAVSTVIPGARNAEQAQSNCATNLLPPLTEKELKAVDAIVPPGGGRKIWPA